MRHLVVMTTFTGNEWTFQITTNGIYLRYMFIYVVGLGSIIIIESIEPL